MFKRLIFRIFGRERDLKEAIWNQWGGRPKPIIPPPPPRPMFGHIKPLETGTVKIGVAYGQSIKAGDMITIDPNGRAVPLTTRCED